MGLGNLWGLIGGGHIKANPYTADQTNAAANLGNVGNAYERFGQDGLNQYNQFAPQYNEAVTQQSRLLNSDPYTDSYSAGKIAQATGATTAAYQSAKANLQAEMARRGISGGSAETGGLASIDAGRAGAISGAANTVAQNAIQQRYTNAANNVALYGNATNGARSAYLDALGGAAGAASGQAGIYGNAANQWTQTQEYNGQQDNALFGMIGSLAGSAASAYGKTRSAGVGGGSTSAGGGWSF